MKKFIVYVVILTMALTAKSQDVVLPSAYISLGGGINLPMGEFASTSSSDGNAGYAKMGYHYQYTAVLPLNKSRFGIGVKLYLLGNPMDGNAILNSNISNNTDPNANNFGESVSANYTMFVYMAGVSYTIPYNKVSVDFRFLAGLCSATFPSTTFSENSIDTQTGNPVTAYVYNNSATSSVVAFNIGVDFRYCITHHFVGMVNLDFLRASPSFAITKMVTATEYDPSSGNYITATQSDNATFNRPMGLINAGVGFGYQF